MESSAEETAKYISLRFFDQVMPSSLRHWEEAPT